jgi:hypothetical protein
LHLADGRGESVSMDETQLRGSILASQHQASIIFSTAMAAKLNGCSANPQALRSVRSKHPGTWRRHRVACRR